MKTSNPTLILLAREVLLKALCVSLGLLEFKLLKHLLFLQPEQTAEDSNTAEEPEKPQKAPLKSKLSLYIFIPYVYVTNVHTCLAGFLYLTSSFQKNQAMCRLTLLLTAEQAL